QRHCQPTARRRTNHHPVEQRVTDDGHPQPDQRIHRPIRQRRERRKVNVKEGGRHTPPCKHQPATRHPPRIRHHMERKIFTRGLSQRPRVILRRSLKRRINRFRSSHFPQTSSFR